jgi:hypothetical protein
MISHAKDEAMSAAAATTVFVLSKTMVIKSDFGQINE